MPRERRDENALLLMSNTVETPGVRGFTAPAQGSCFSLEPGEAPRNQ